MSDEGECVKRIIKTEIEIEIETRYKKIKYIINLYSIDMCRRKTYNS